MEIHNITHVIYMMYDYVFEINVTDMIENSNLSLITEKYDIFL